jgi:hypothetical protein
VIEASASTGNGGYKLGDWFVAGAQTYALWNTEPSIYAAGTEYVTPVTDGNLIGIGVILK